MSSSVILPSDVSPRSMKQLSCSAVSMINVSQTPKIKSSLNRHKLSSKSHSGLNNSCSSQLILSSRNMKLITQDNEIKNLKQHIEFLTNENKTIRTQNFRQQKEIDSKNNDDLSMANLFKQHEADIYNLKEQVRKTRSSLSKEQKLRNDIEVEASVLKASLNKRQEIITETQLLEKYDLKRQLDTAQETLSTKEGELETIKKQLDSQEKNYKIELAHFHKQAKTSNDRCKELEAHIKFLLVSLKEKQRLLDIQNIYCNRINVAKINKKASNKYPCSECMIEFDPKHCGNQVPVLGTSMVDPPRKDSFEANNKIDADVVPQKKIKQNGRERSRMIEDIRKIILEELNLGSFPQLNPPCPSQLEYRTISPIKILKTDLLIKSPIIRLDHPTGNKRDSINTTDVVDEKGSNLTRYQSALAHFEKPLQKKVPLILREESSSSEGILKKKFKGPNKNSQEGTETLRDVRIPSVYLHPNQEAIVDNENWYKDIETIAVLDAVCDVKNHYQKHQRSDPSEDTSFLRTSSKSFYPIKGKFKFSQPILEDLKNKGDVINEHLKKNLMNKVIGVSDSRITKATPGSHLKSSLQKYIFLRKCQNSDLSLNQSE